MKSLSILFLFIFAINANTDLSKADSTTIASFIPPVGEERCFTYPDGHTIFVLIEFPPQG